MRSGSGLSQSASHLKVSREVANPQELVQRMVEVDPEKARQLYELESKPKMVLTEEELRLE